MSTKQELFKSIEAPVGIDVDRGHALKPCFLCGRTEARRLYMQAHFPVVRCRGCGLVYADEHFRKDELDAFYTGDYYERAYVCHPKEIDRKIANDYVRAFRRVERIVPGGGRLLDFGSARGTFLLELGRRGIGAQWRYEGIDINPDEVAMGRAAGLEITCATLEDSGIPAESFDAVTAFSVLEHLQDPSLVLDRIAAVTKKGGALLAIVPHGECLIIKLAVLAAKLLGERARRFADNVFHEEHLYYFSRESLTRALDRAGFDVVEWFFEPSYLETHPTGPLVAAGAYSLRFLSWALRQQTMLGVLARRRS